jgi:coproporphyrinogen III oxidase-like Fe-S oxidoreductase
MRCRHNLNYWEFGDYLGIGAGAHGKVSLPDRVERHARVKQPREYMEAAMRGESAVENRAIHARELPFEFMLNAGRLVEGFAPALYTARTGLPVATLEPGLRRAEAKGLIERSLERIRPTDRGLRFLNDLQQIFLS